MIRMRGYKIELKLNDEQRRLCYKSAGTSRYAYNWMLKKLSAEYETNKSLATMYDLPKVPSTHGTAMDWHKEWVKLKKQDGYKWIYETSKCTGQEALRDLQVAFQNFFKSPKGYPKLKKKGVDDSFRLNGCVYIGYDFVQLPNFGKVKLKEKGYAPVGIEGKLKLTQATVSRQADRWFVSFLIKDEIDVTKPNLNEIQVDDIVGVDLGIKDLAITSYGETFDNPKEYKKKIQKLKRFQRSVSRKKKGSKNRKKAITKLAKVHKQVADVRNDAIHKMTTSIVKTKPKMIVIESLKPLNMSKNRKLASSILDASFGKIKEQFKYKSEWNGIHLVQAHTFYASSQFCSKCGFKNTKLKLEDRNWVCEECGTHHDRDYNASLNLKFYGLWLLDLLPDSLAGIACPSGEHHLGAVGGFPLKHRDGRLQFFNEQCLSKKQEFISANFALVA